MKLFRPSTFQRRKPALALPALTARSLANVNEESRTTSSEEFDYQDVSVEQVLPEEEPSQEQSSHVLVQTTVSLPSEATSTEKVKQLPAADSAIMQLPWTRILPSDRQAFQHDESECSICCERLIDGFTITRLPCGHLYHYTCSLPWLTRHNSCPECRYELQTRSSRHEQGRVERMKSRRVVECGCNVSHLHRCFFVDKTKGRADQLVCTATAA